MLATRYKATSCLQLMLLFSWLVCGYSAAKANHKSYKPEVTTLSGNIVIDSLEFLDTDDGGQQTERHHYDQAESPESTVKKPEQRSESEMSDQDEKSASNEQVKQIQVEPTIIDHRPNELQLQQQDYLPSTSTQSSLTTTSASSVSSTTPSVTTTTTTSPLSQHPAAGSVQVQAQQQQAYATGSNSHPTSWFQPNSGFLQTQQQPILALQGQYPNSINSIINDHHGANNQQPVQAASQQIVNLNGQPTSVLLLANPSGQSQQASANGPRRISLSGWLRQISSMLANIFNRREHGALLGGPAGNQWIQLGPNAPHWLTQAQSFMQNQQQQTHQLLGSASSNTRYYLQAPPSNNVGGIQPVLPVVQQQQASSAQQGNASPVTQFSSTTGDLQASSSHPIASYVQVTSFQQAPAGSTVQANGKQPTAPAQQQQQQSNQVLQTQAPQQVSSSTWPSTVRQGARTQISAPAHQGSQLSQNLPLAHYM